MKNIKVRLNRNYNNGFLVTQGGLTFYKKDNQLKREESVVEVTLDDFEVRQLINQKILVIVDEKVKEEVAEVIEKLDKKSVQGQTTKNNFLDKKFVDKEAIIEKPKKSIKESIKDSVKEEKPKESIKEPKNNDELIDGLK
jgi:hypothetical protein